MNPFDRDSELERRQIREISVNVARRLLDVLERRHLAPPAVAAEIAARARVIADIQREIDGIMAGLPEAELLDIAVLTHVLASHGRALSLIEELETRTPAHHHRAHAHPDTHPDAERTHARLIATAREIEREARQYDPEPAPTTRPPPHNPLPLPPQGPQGAAPYRAPPAPAGYHPAAPSRTARTGPGAGARNPTRAQPRTQPQPLHRPQAVPPSRLQALRALASSPVGAVALVAVIAIVAASLAGALSLALSTGSGETDRHIAAARVSPGKFDGRLSAADAVEPGGADILVVTPPANAAELTQPYLVVLATRRTMEELDQDFRYFQQQHSALLSNARGRVDRVDTQDGKTWYRLSLIPPRSQEEAAALCAELKAGGLNECWINPLPLGRDASG